MTMNTTGNMDGTAAASGGILSRERTIAKAGFNRWRVPPAALAIHLCIGMAHGFSVFWLPLSCSVGTAIGAKVPACAGAATTFWDKTLGHCRAGNRSGRSDRSGSPFAWLQTLEPRIEAQETKEGY